MAGDFARIEAALRYIPADLPREDWARVAMALKAELGEPGLDLFDAWSKPGRSYDPAAVRSTWRSVSADGGVKIGTLFAMARSHGWQPPPDPAKRKRSATDAAPAARSQAKPPPLASAPADPATDEKAAKQGAAATAARGLWERSQPAPAAHPYLTRHKVKAGLLRQSGGDLLAPMFDAAGVLWNVQRIRRDGQKRFTPGGRVSGLVCPVRAINAGSTAALLCEGVATALAIAAALPPGVAVCAAFSAGNLAAAARALRSAWPALPIVVAADDDSVKHSDGRNPGREAAEKAAAAVGGLVALPEQLSADETDFADLGKRDPAAAASVLAAAVAKACAARAVPLAPHPAAAGASPAGDALAIFDEPGRDGDPFRLTREGVFWLRPRNGEPGVFDSVKLAAPLKIEARSRDESGHGWGYSLAFVDAAGQLRRWVMPARLTSGDGAELRARLLDDGLWIAPGQAARGKLLEYLTSRHVAEFVRTTERTGWAGASYVLPAETFGPAGAERVVFTGDAGQRDPFNRAGTLADWQQHIAAPAAGNSRAVFGLSLAFAAPCLAFLGLESGGVHLVGDSGGGKTTLLKLAASVYGGGDFALTWRATGNALEASAASRNDGLLALDEIGMTEAAEAGATVYSLMSGAQKGRLNSGAVLRARLSWRVLLLSTGELDLASHVAEGGKQVRAGQEARLVSLPADAGRGLGVWDQLHGAISAAEFSEALGTAAARFHGTAGQAWLRRLVDERDPAADGIRSHVRELCEMWTSPGDSGQVRRVAVRFALAAAAGELAALWGIVPWQAGEAERAAQRLLGEWIARRGGRDNAEPRQMLQTAAERLLSGLGNFQWATRAADDHSAAKPRTWGVRRLLKSDGAAVESDSAFGVSFGQKISAAEADETSSELLIFTPVFRSEIARGFDAGRMARVLFERGHLRPEDAAGKRLDRKERLPGLAGGGGGARVYVILPSLFDDPWLGGA